MGRDKNQQHNAEKEKKQSATQRMKDNGWETGDKVFEEGETIPFTKTNERYTFP